MSGNFDFPPANTGHTSSALEDASRVIEHARAQRDNMRARLGEYRRLREQLHDPRRLAGQQSTSWEGLRHPQDAEWPPFMPSLTPSTHGSASVLRARHDRVRLRARYRLHSRGQTLGREGTVQEAMERLNEASSNSSSLLDQPTPTMVSQDVTGRENSSEAEMNRRRKRRKLDVDSTSTGHLGGFKYGYRGQVIPGPLKMELVTCDGGLHSEAAKHGREYWPDNVLRNDKSVYCTDNSRCNLILRHMGETTFCLKKVVIKAPEKGFTAPIQEGMIFIAMESTDLLARTSRYQMRDCSPLKQSDGREPSSSEDPSGSRPLSRRRDSESRTVPPPISNSIPRVVRHLDFPVRSDPSMNSSPPNNSSDHPTPTTPKPPEPLGFHVTTHCNDPSSDEEEPSSATTLVDRYRRNRLHVLYESSSDEDAQLARNTDISASYSGRRSRRREKPSRIGIKPPDAPGSLTEGKDVNMLAPHARFFIEKERSVITVKFDPPISGKFILLKLWSPAKDQNIDIQSIVAHGFAGPRFFPATQMM